MSFLIERVVRINGEERQRSTVVSDLKALEAITVPVCTVNAPLLADAEIEVDLTFDPPLTVPATSEDPR